MCISSTSPDQSPPEVPTMPVVSDAHTRTRAGSYCSSPGPPALVSGAPMAMHRGTPGHARAGSQARNAGPRATPPCPRLREPPALSTGCPCPSPGTAPALFAGCPCPSRGTPRPCRRDARAPSTGPARRRPPMGPSARTGMADCRAQDGRCRTNGCSPVRGARVRSSARQRPTERLGGPGSAASWDVRGVPGPGPRASR